MRVSLTSTGALERRLEVAVPAADVDKVYSDRLKAFGRTARLKGFRPGKAPAKVVEQQFGGQIAVDPDHLFTTITDLALSAKSEIDKIREQSLNLE